MGYKERRFFEGSACKVFTVDLFDEGSLFGGKYAAWEKQMQTGAWRSIYACMFLLPGTPFVENFLSF